MTTPTESPTCSNGRESPASVNIRICCWSVMPRPAQVWSKFQRPDGGHVKVTCVERGLRWRFGLLAIVVVAVVLFMAVMLWSAQFS
jgi:hypothetical protein